MIQQSIGHCNWLGNNGKNISYGKLKLSSPERPWDVVRILFSIWCDSRRFAATGIHLIDRCKTKNTKLVE